MKITEKMLLDGYEGLASGGSFISTVEGKRIFWNYRINNGDGTYCVCDRNKKGQIYADIITLEYNRRGEIEVMPENNDHLSLAKIKSDEAKLYGDEV
jgi:hypothetical protein